MDWFAIDVNTRQEKKAFSLEGSFDAKATVKLQAHLKGQKLVPELNFLQQDFKLKSSEIGEISVSTMNTIFNFAFNNGIIPYINLYVKDGFPIPTIPEGRLVNPVISFNSKYLVVATDIEYTAKSMEEEVETLSK
jgi:hypothetical protein